MPLDMPSFTAARRSSKNLRPSATSCLPKVTVPWPCTRVSKSSASMLRYDLIHSDIGCRSKFPQALGRERIEVRTRASAGKSVENTTFSAGK